MTAGKWARSAFVGGRWALTRDVTGAHARILASAAEKRPPKRNACIKLGDTQNQRLCRARGGDFYLLKG